MESSKEELYRTYEEHHNRVPWDPLECGNIFERKQLQRRATAECHGSLLTMVSGGCGLASRGSLPLLHVLLFHLLSWRGCSALDLAECIVALGMESGHIRDEAINASSSHNEASVGPQNARLNRELQSGAWCPENQISRDVHEYLEVRLPGLHVVTAVATQGRFGNGQGREYTEEYLLEYWRPGMPAFRRFADRRGIEIFQGNTNTYSVVKRLVDPPVIATQVRFVPYSVHLRTICMRVEVYGCPSADGLLSYAMPQGDQRGVDLDLSDRTYDGVRDDSYLRGGLGQLVDGRRGEDNFRADADGLGKGYDWVGWKNDTGGLSTLLGSGAGPLWGGDRRPIEILFTFDAVRNFSAAYFHCNNMHSRDVQVFSSATFWFSVGGSFFHRHRAVQFSYMPDLYLERARNVTVYLHHGIGRLLRAELHFASRWMLISEVSFDSVPASGNFTEEEPPAAPPIVSTALNEDALGHRYVGLVIGVLAAVILLLVLVILVIVARSRRRKNDTHAHSTVTVNMKDLGLTFSSCPSTGSSVYGQVAGDDPDRLLYQEPQDIKDSYTGTYSSGSTMPGEYAIPDIQKNGPPRLPSDSQHYYAAAAVVELPNIQGVCGTSLYAEAAPGSCLLDGADKGADLRQVPQGSLQYLEKIGEGQFGEVHLCRFGGVAELVDVPCSSSSLVSVRSLRSGTGPAVRRRFLEEAHFLSRLRDPNVLTVVGVCEGPPCLVVEYPEDGDLYQYLNQHSPDTTRTPNGTREAKKTLSHGCLIYMAAQVASGMKYLSSLGLVHRDLAARNCLVGRGHCVKVSELATARRNLYADHYMQRGGVLLPVRWMAWESLATSKFSSKSDVWSFAVTLWEILTFARHLPLSELSDEQVLVQPWGQPLPQPQRCPREIYDLMRECWRKNEQDRPNFREIHLFLQRKNLGYVP